MDFHDIYLILEDLGEVISSGRRSRMFSHLESDNITTLALENRERGEIHRGCKSEAFLRSVGAAVGFMVLELPKSGTILQRTR